MKKLLSVMTGFVVTMAAIAVLLTTGVNVKTVSAEGAEHKHCVCGGNVSVINDAEAEGHAAAVAMHGACDATQVWTAWTSTTTLPTTSGYYYLTNDVLVSGVQEVSETDGASIHLCLNGHKVTRTNNSSSANAASENESLKFYLASKTADWVFDICDCSEGQAGGFEYAEGKVHHQSNNDGTSFFQYYSKGTLNLYCANIGQATIVTVNDTFGAIPVVNSSTLNMYSGTFNGAKLYKTYEFTTLVGSSGAVLVNDNATFNLFGGTIQNGMAAADANIRVRGVFNMYGGEVKDGYTSGSGGNIGTFAFSGTYKTHAVNIYGGKVTGGTALGLGGNLKIYAHATTTSAFDCIANLNITGGEISGGKAKQGGNIALYGASATNKTDNKKYCGYSQATISNCVIKDGEATTEGGNIYQRGYRGKVNNIYQDWVVMSNVTIKDGKAGTNGGNLNIGYGSAPCAFTMQSGEILGGTATGFGGSIAVNLSSEFIMEDGLVSGGVLTTTSNGSPKYNSTTPKNSVNVTKGFGGNIGGYGNADIIICGGTVQNGKVTATGTGWAMGGNIGAVTNINGSGNINQGYIYIVGGVIKNGIVESTSTSTQARSVAGANVCVGGPVSWSMDGKTTLKIYGGTLTHDIDDGATHTKYGAYYNGDSAVNAYGGNILTNGTGHVYNPGGSFSINGKTYVGGPVTISNGYVYSKTGSAFGGNIYNHNATRTLTNITILNGYVEPTSVSGKVSRGGNIYCTGGISYTLDHCTVSGGYAVDGGNIFTEADNFTMKNGTVISDGVATKQGGNVYVAQTTTAVATLEDTSVITRGYAPNNSAGNVMCSGKFVMNGGEISYGTATGAGNVFINIGNAVESDSTRGIFTMNGGVIKDGATYSSGLYGYGNGANVAINGNLANAAYFNAKFIMNGGEILMSGEEFTGKDGKKHVYGENGDGASITVQGYFEMNDGLVSGGNAVRVLTKGTTDIRYSGRGGCICTGRADATRAANQGHYPWVKISGGTIEGGSAYQYSGLLCIQEYGKAEISGGVFKNGTNFGGDNSVPGVSILANASLTVTGGTFLVNNVAKENAIWANAAAVLDISGENTYIQKLYGQPDITAFLSGGYFEKSPAARCLKTGYGSVEMASPKTSEGQNFGYEVCLAHTLNTTSWLIDGEGAKVSSGIATIIGGGYAKNGTGKTITASETPNYTFVGWATLESLDATTYAVISGATNLAYTTEGTESEEFYVALYKNEKTTVHYEVKGNAQVSGLEKSGDVALGTKITISFTGNSSFVGFTNEVNKMISTATEIELTLYSDTTVVAVEKAEVGTGEHEFIFQTESDQIYKTIVAASLTELPAVPVHYGKEGGFWSLTKGGAEATLEEINAAAASVDALTLYLTGYTGKTPMKELTAKTEAQIEMNIAAATKVGDKFTVSLGATRLLPEGFTVVEQGILLTTGAKVADEAAAKAALVIGATGIGKLRSTSTELSGVTSANVQNVPENTTIYAVGYVIYLRDGSTTPEYLYTAVSTVEAK